jgi:hypothetical protein
MSDSRERAYSLQDEALLLPYGPTKVALLEEAVRIADTHNDVDLAFELRQDLMSAATFSGRADIMLVAYAWCLAEYDRNPDLYDSYDILWKFKWVVGNAVGFPEISRPRLEELLADMERRFRAAGSSMHAVYHKQRELMSSMGDRQQARLAHARFRKRRRDSLSDCPACVAGEDCGYLAFQRQWRRAVSAAQVVLDGRLTCAEEPHRTLGRVLLPLVHLGRIDEAKTIHAKGYRLVRGVDHFVMEHARHLRFVVLVGDMAQAKRMLERHLPAALATVTADDRFEFLLAARLWIDRLANDGVAQVKVRLPKGLPVSETDGKTDVALLGQWFTDEAKKIALRFDARNSNDYFQRQLEGLPALLDLATV